MAPSLSPGLGYCIYLSNYFASFLIKLTMPCIKSTKSVNPIANRAKPEGARLSSPEPKNIFLARAKLCKKWN
ncbi:hypothetical protein [Dulcicalothrix desertica]|uniref:hypothetical protein n=1 Tax=Dulcicalothrix desertica TaxID=32056 RepID=UPI000F8ED748|nr:hypothetical protein [Dulcicalothrix desertica]